MSVQIATKWRIDADERCFILQRLVTRTAKKDNPEKGLKAGDSYTEWGDDRYFRTIPQAIECLKQDALRQITQQEWSSIGEMIDAITKMGSPIPELTSAAIARGLS